MGNSSTINEGNAPVINAFTKLIKINQEGDDGGKEKAVDDQGGEKELDDRRGLVF